METRVLVAVILSIAVLYGYSMIFPTPKPVPPQTVQTQQITSTASPVSAIKPEPVQSGAVPANAAPTSLQDVVVETDLFTAVFSTNGAALKKLTLKKYHESKQLGGKEVVLINEEKPDNFNLRSASKEFFIDSSTLYRPSSTKLTLSKGEKKSLDFIATTPQGVTLKKSYQLSGDSYVIGLDQQLINGTPQQLTGSMQLFLVNHIPGKDADSRFEEHGPVAYAEKGLETAKAADVAKSPKTFGKGLLWGGFADKYFLTAILSTNASIGSFVSQQRNSVIDSIVTSPPLTIAPGMSVTLNNKVYVGPKDLDILRSAGNKLEEVIDFGWFSALAKPLLYTLKYFYRFVHNYGVAIIIITIILKVLFFPLTHKSYKSMKEMQKIQPKMNALKEKHKNDRDAMNQAVMELYKTHKVNPLGGCLPMLIQIPVFFALYKALMYSIELRQAPFFFWIQDLSAKDPYYVTPIIMGATMFIQQKMTPTTMDPVQAKVMLSLPIVFTFMFLNFPSGLVLYWLVNNILTIAQQAYINKLLHEEPLPEVSAKRK
jgi:YidC/Oxa1 family membrane protein insertase